MAKCSNCGASMSCGCQRRQLPDGKMGCSKCAPPDVKKVNKTETPKN